MLEKELAFFERNLREWLSRGKERVALVKNESLVGLYDSEDAAFKDGAARFGLSPFLIRRVTTDLPTYQAPAYALGLLRAVH